MTTEDESPEDETPRTEPTERFHVEWSDGEHPSTAVVEAVAATTDRAPEELPSLYDYVDADALDALVASRSAGRDGRVEVSFTYGGVHVSVASDGQIELRPDAAERG